MLNKLKNLLLLKKDTSGDTILEVMIAGTILALVLVGAITLTNKNLQSERQSQEHGEALGIVQSQLEELRNYSLSNPLPPTPIGGGSGGTICMYNDQAYPSFSSNCRVDSAGNPSTTEPYYNIAITIPTGIGNSLYGISVTWDSVTGIGQENVQFYYNIYSTYNS